MTIWLYKCVLYLALGIDMYLSLIGNNRYGEFTKRRDSLLDRAGGYIYTNTTFSYGNCQLSATLLVWIAPCHERGDYTVISIIWLDNSQLLVTNHIATCCAGKARAPPQELFSFKGPVEFGRIMMIPFLPFLDPPLSSTDNRQQSVVGRVNAQLLIVNTSRACQAVSF